MRVSDINDNSKLVHSDTPLTEKEKLQLEISEAKKIFDLLKEKMTIAARTRNRQQYQAARVKAESIQVRLKRLRKLYFKQFPDTNDNITVVGEADERQDSE